MVLTRFSHGTVTCTSFVGYITDTYKLQRLAQCPTYDLQQPRTTPAAVPATAFHDHQYNLSLSSFEQNLRKIVFVMKVVDQDTMDTLSTPNPFHLLNHNLYFMKKEYHNEKR